MDRKISDAAANDAKTAIETVLAAAAVVVEQYYSMITIKTW